jgi:hypothetical protein
LKTWPKSFESRKARPPVSLASVTINVSDSGICFYSDRNLSECDKVEVRERGSRVARSGKVIWCGRHEDLGIYLVGISLKYDDREFAGLSGGYKTFQPS